MLKRLSYLLSVTFALLCSLTFGLFMASSDGGFDLPSEHDSVLFNGHHRIAEAYLPGAGGLTTSFIETADVSGEREHICNHLQTQLQSEVSSLSFRKGYHAQMLSRVTYVYRDRLFPFHHFL